MIDQPTDEGARAFTAGWDAATALVREACHDAESAERGLWARRAGGAATWRELDEAWGGVTALRRAHRLLETERPSPPADDGRAILRAEHDREVRAEREEQARG